MLLLTSLLQPTTVIKPPPAGQSGSVAVPAQSIAVKVGTNTVTIAIPAYTITVSTA